MRIHSRGVIVQRGLLAAVAATLVVPVVVGAQVRASDEQRRRDQIQLMEGVLSRAVRLGAEQVNRRMQSIDPTISVITGQARARGFVLEGYGVFFDVEVPPMSASAVWSMMTVQRDVQVAASLDSLRRAISRCRRVRSCRRRSRRSSASRARSAPCSAAARSAGERRRAGQHRGGRQYAAGHGRSQSAVHRGREECADRRDARSQPVDGSRRRTSGSRSRAAERGPLAQNQLYDVSTIVLRVKGSDLAAYAADRTKRGDVRHKVEVRVF